MNSGAVACTGCGRSSRTVTDQDLRLRAARQHILRDQGQLPADETLRDDLHRARVHLRAEWL